MRIGIILREALTLAIINFGALEVFLLRRWFPPTSDNLSPGLWVRFSLLVFVLAVIGLIEGMLYMF
jgi:hypothetical protein